MYNDLDEHESAQKVFSVSGNLEIEHDNSTTGMNGMHLLSVNQNATSN
jgi:hypothetical protein